MHVIDTIDFVSGPNGLASALRTRLLQSPFNTPSLPLDIGYSEAIPAHIRRAVIHRWGGQIPLHPDGTSEARSQDGRQILRSHAPPTTSAA